jgi:hypothetical protein
MVLDLLLPVSSGGRMGFTPRCCDVAAAREKKNKTLKKNKLTYVSIKQKKRNE